MSICGLEFQGMGGAPYGYDISNKGEWRPVNEVPHTDTVLLIQVHVGKQKYRGGGR